MIKKLQLLFTPHQSNNQKAKVLHLSSLSTFILIIMVFQVIMSTVSYRFPGVLGYASNISGYDLIKLTNEKRESQGLGVLKINEKLAEAARQKANEMFVLDYWAHYSPAGKSPWWFFQNVGYSYRYAGENLARDFDQSPNVVKAWMNSPTHRDNILNPDYQEIGIAVVDGLLQGQETTLVIQMFGAPIPETAADKNIEAVAAEEEAIPTTSISSPATGTAVLSEAKKLTQPLFNSFNLTKTISAATIGLLTIILLVDIALVYQRRTIRISGKTLAHAIFVLTLLGMVLFSHQGAIL